MTTQILMPRLSPTMEEGTLAKWHVKEGDTVKSGDVIAEIETDKATMEVEAADEGVVEKLLARRGHRACSRQPSHRALAVDGEGARGRSGRPLPKERTQLVSAAQERRGLRSGATWRKMRHAPRRAAIDDGSAEAVLNRLPNRSGETAGPVTTASASSPLRSRGGSRASWP